MNKSSVEKAIEYQKQGKSFRSFENEEDISALESGAIWSEAAKRLKALTPLERADLWEAMKAEPEKWQLTTEEMYWHILEAVPPRAMRPDSFLGGEPDHHNNEGVAVYASFRKVGDKYEARYLTLNEFNKGRD